MDKIDRQILRELIKDAQTPFLRIAKKIDVSPETVRKKYMKMKENGIIRHCSISIDLSRIGYQGKAFFLIRNAVNHDKSRTIEALKKISNIFVISEIIGDFEIIAIAPVKGISNLKAMLSKIKKLPSVSRVEFTLIDDTTFPVDSRFGKLFLE